MADNVTLQSTTVATLPSGTVVATDSIGAVNYQRVKISLGADGVAADADVGSGTGGSATLRIIQDSSQTPALGQTTQSGGIPIAIPSDVPTIPVVANQGLTASATFTPGSTNHTAGACVGAAQQFSFGATSARDIMLTGASLLINNTSAFSSAWRVHIYNVTPPSAIADSTAWDLPNGDTSAYLGSIDLPTTATDLGSNQWVETNGVNKQVKLSGTSVFAYLMNQSTITTVASSHIVTLHAVQL